MASTAHPAPLRPGESVFLHWSLSDGRLFWNDDASPRPPSLRRIPRSSCRSWWLAAPGFIWMALFFSCRSGWCLRSALPRGGPMAALSGTSRRPTTSICCTRYTAKFSLNRMWYATMTTALCFLSGVPARLCHCPQPRPLAADFLAARHVAVLDQFSRADLCLDDSVAP